MSSQYQSLSRIPGQLGYLVVSDDGAIIVSAGELQNDERIARQMFRMVYTLQPRKPFDSVSRIIIHFDDFFYVVCVSNKKLVIIKRRTDASTSAVDVAV